MHDILTHNVILLVTRKMAGQRGIDWSAILIAPVILGEIFQVIGISFIFKQLTQLNSHF
jgi:hypothetical protein